MPASLFRRDSIAASRPVCPNAFSRGISAGRREEPRCDSISGPAGERDWERFRSLFIPEAQLIASISNKDGALTYKSMTVQGYIDGAGKYFKEHGFYEREISRKLESFGSVTHIFSTYESRETADGRPFERGINSIQLFADGSRWWIVDVYWTGETPENPIPARYL